MKIFNRHHEGNPRSRRARRPAKGGGESCPTCASHDTSVSYIDRVTVTVTHRCRGCNAQWRTPFIDLTAVASSKR